MARSFKERLVTGKSIAKFCSMQIGKDPKLLVFPVLAGIMIFLVSSLWIAIRILFPDVEALPEYVRLIIFIVFLVSFVIMYSIIRVFFEAAMVAYVHERMEGHRSSVGLGFSRASGRAGMLFKWAVLNGIVGVIIRFLEMKSSEVGGESKITTEDGKETEYSSFQGVWSMVTYFVLPMILYEDTRFWKLPVRSERLVTEFWGEVLVGRLAVGIVFALLVIPAIILCIIGLILESSTGYVIVAITVAYLISIASVRGVSGGVLSAAMYRYTQTGKLDLEVPQWIHPTDAPISRGGPEVDIDIAKRKADEKAIAKAAKEAPKEGYFLYYLKGVLALTVFLLVVLGFMLFPGDNVEFEFEADTIYPSIGLCSTAVIIVVIMFAAGWITSVPDTPEMSQNGPITQVSSRLTVGNRVMVSNPNGSHELGMVTGMEHGMVTVRLNDGTECQYDESACMKL